MEIKKKVTSLNINVKKAYEMKLKEDQTKDITIDKLIKESKISKIFFLSNPI